MKTIEKDFEDGIIQIRKDHNQTRVLGQFDRCNLGQDGRGRGRNCGDRGRNFSSRGRNRGSRGHNIRGRRSFGNYISRQY